MTSYQSEEDFSMIFQYKDELRDFKLYYDGVQDLVIIVFGAMKVMQMVFRLLCGWLHSKMQWRMLQQKMRKKIGGKREIGTEIGGKEQLEQL
jgi:hypothetical protein